MSKKKLFARMMVLMIMIGGFSFAIEGNGMVNSMASVLEFDVLKGEVVDQALYPQQQEKVKRKVKVSRDEAMQFIGLEDMKGFQSEYGVLSNEMVTEQARRDVENLEMRFEDLR